MKKEQASAKSQLGINNLSRAFLSLLFGYGFAIIVFVAEVFLKSINAWK
jgi:hypothetical protein